MAVPWFRFYTETLDDLKLVRASTEAGVEKMSILGAWAGLLALANGSPYRGRLLLSGGLPLTIPEMAFKIGTDVQTLKAIIDAFEVLNMVCWDDGVLVIINWDARQFKSDHSAERVRQHRERQTEPDDEGDEEAEENSTGSEGDDNNVGETLQECYSNVSVTPPEQSRIRAESDQNRTEHGADAPPPPPSPPKSPKPKRTSNPPPEAVKVFRANAHRYPAKAWYEDVDQAVGDDQANLDFWGQVVKAWVGLGWNPTNVKGMLEFFKRREIPAVKGGNGRSGSNYPSNRTLAKPPAVPVDPAQVERDRATLRAHRGRQQGDVGG